VIVLVKHRIGPSVYVGPFQDMEDVKGWVDTHTPDTSWSIIYMQSTDGPPDWNI
jgi:hypothetical protein